MCAAFCSDLLYSASPPRPCAQTPYVSLCLLVRVLHVQKHCCLVVRSTWSSWAGASSLPHSGWEWSETLMCVCVWLLPIVPPPKTFHTHRDSVMLTPFPVYFDQTCCISLRLLVCVCLRLCESCRYHSAEMCCNSCATFWSFLCFTTPPRPCDQTCYVSSKLMVWSF